jgi:hypothetical protein
MVWVSRIDATNARQGIGPLSSGSDSAFYLLRFWGSACTLWRVWQLPSGVHTGNNVLDLILSWLLLAILIAIGAGFWGGIPGMHATQIRDRDHYVDCGALNVRP